MLRFTQVLARIRAFVSRARLDRDFDEELRSHVEMLTDDNLARGMSADAARRTLR